MHFGRWSSCGGAVGAAPFAGTFFPWGRWGRSNRFFGPGEVRLALLSLLSEGPKHGYELMKELENRSGGIYRASAGAIYPALQQLEDEGLVTAEQAEGKRTYRLIDPGKQEIEHEAESIARIWRRAKQWQDWGPWMGAEGAAVAGPAADVMKSALRAATRGSSDSQRVTKIRQILERARREIQELDRD